MTTNYIDYKFTANGVNFISRVFSHSELFDKIANLPAGIFAQLNQEAMRDMIGDASLLTTAELLEELERVNEGGTHAFIMLDEEVSA